MRGLLALLLVGACSSGTTVGAPSPSTTPSPAPAPVVTAGSPAASPTPSPTRPPVWVVGASPLPLRPDGFGKVLPTPAVLRDRKLQAADVLPAPPDGKWHSTTGAVTQQIRLRMGTSYKSTCPTKQSSLRYLTLTFRGFDGAAHTGELVVADRAVVPTLRAFRRLFDLGFPIEEMRLPTSADMSAPPTGDGNGTAAFVCRAARGQKRLSAHAYGLAIDVNPFQNPYVKGDLVLPELASAYRDRTWVRAGMFLRGSPATRAFTDNGFTWGGTFSRPKDYQHMTLTGN